MRSALILVCALLEFKAYAEVTPPNTDKIIEDTYSTSRTENLEIEYESPKEAHLAISSKSSNRRVEVEDIEAFADIEAGVLWVFTLPHNPAHPAVMKLRAFEGHEGIYMRTAVTCGAAKDECDKFVSYQQYLTNSVLEIYRVHANLSNR